jgi:hypothetical protein
MSRFARLKNVSNLLCLTREETGTTGDPVLAVRGDAPTRHHAVHMGMMLQVLPPGVQERDEADLGAQELVASVITSMVAGRGLSLGLVYHPHSNLIKTATRWIGTTSKKHFSPGQALSSPRTKDSRSRSSGESSLPSVITIARRTRLISSRTLPGQV